MNVCPVGTKSGKLGYQPFELNRLICLYKQFSFHSKNKD